MRKPLSFSYKLIKSVYVHLLYTFGSQTWVFYHEKELSSAASLLCARKLVEKHQNTNGNLKKKLNIKRWRGAGNIFEPNTDEEATVEEPQVTTRSMSKGIPPVNIAFFCSSPENLNINALDWNCEGLESI